MKQKDRIDCFLKGFKTPNPQIAKTIMEINNEIDEGVIDVDTGKIMEGEKYINNSGILSIENPEYRGTDIVEIDLVFWDKYGSKAYARLIDRSRYMDIKDYIIWTNEAGDIYADRGFFSYSDSSIFHRMPILRDVMNLFGAAEKIYLGKIA